MNSESELSKYKLGYEYHDDLPEIRKAVRRAKDRVRKAMEEKRRKMKR